MSRSHNASLLHRKADGSRNAAGMVALPCPIIECGSLCIFLQMLPTMPPTSVLLMPVSKREGVMGSLKTTTAVQVTACIEQEGQQSILTATCVAAVCVTVGGAGSLLWPCEERAKPAESLWQRVNDLQAELLHCLTLALQAHPAVACVQAPARYRIPDEWLWSHPASLDGSGIQFVASLDDEAGHWTRQASVPQAGAESSSEPPCL